MGAIRYAAGPLVLILATDDRRLGGGGASMSAYARRLSLALVVGCFLVGLDAAATYAGPAVACGDSAPQCSGSCPTGQTCVEFTRGGVTSCACRNVGCCQLPSTSCTDDVTALSCLIANGTWGVGDTCAGGCQVGTGDPNGSPCTAAADCLSDNCVDGVCCNTDCNGLNEACTLPGQVGTCASVATPSPLVSSTGGLLIVASLLLIGVGNLARGRGRPGS